MWCNSKNKGEEDHHFELGIKLFSSYNEKKSKAREGKNEKGMIALTARVSVIDHGGSKATSKWRRARIIGPLYRGTAAPDEGAKDVLALLTIETKD